MSKKKRRKPSSGDNPWDDPEMKAWSQHVIDDAVPKIKECAVTVSLVPDPPTKADIKLAVELGLTIMLDKPLICVITPGMKVPSKLIQVADRIIEWEPDRADLSDALAATIREVVGD